MVRRANVVDAGWNAAACFSANRATEAIIVEEKGAMVFVLGYTYFNKRLMCVDDLESRSGEGRDDRATPWFVVCLPPKNYVTQAHRRRQFFWRGEDLRQDPFGLDRDKYISLVTTRKRLHDTS